MNESTEGHVSNPATGSVRQRVLGRRNTTRRSSRVAMLVAVLAATTWGAGIATALPSEPDEDPCTNPDWQPAECSPGPGSFDPDLGEHIVIGKDPDPQLAYNEALDEARNLCRSFDIKRVQWKQLPRQWKATVTIGC